MSEKIIKFYFTYQKLDTLSYNPINHTNLIKDKICSLYLNKLCSELKEKIEIKIQNSIYLVCFINILEYKDIVFKPEYFTWAPVSIENIL